MTIEQQIAQLEHQKKELERAKEREEILAIESAAKQLCNYKPVYNPSNWICEFDTSTYDATFKYAKLKDNVLMDVNKIIEKHVR